MDLDSSELKLNPYLAFIAPLEHTSIEAGDFPQWADASNRKKNEQVIRAYNLIGIHFRHSFISPCFG